MYNVLVVNAIGKGTTMAVKERRSVRANESEMDALSSLEEALRREPAPAVLLGSNKRIELPPSLFEILCQAAEVLLEGGAVSIMSTAAMLTTQQAADYLGVSRPHFVRNVLDKGEIPFERDDIPGAHRRIRLRDLEEYQRRKERQRRKALAAITRENFELGLYDVDSEAEIRRGP
jgi:excisionase family DNA binding protein